MPTTRIVTGEWARERELEVIEAVQSAMLSALEIPDWDRDIVIDLYDERRRVTPTGKSSRYTRVEVQLFSRRSLKAKRALYRCIVASLAKLGVPESDVKTILIEAPTETFGIRGGTPASEVELGYKIEV
jgi:hypothetical protein